MVVLLKTHKTVPVTCNLYAVPCCVVIPNGMLGYAFESLYVH
jgi:hypothetical protein